MSDSPYIDRHGTLILITLFQDGLIIAADRDVGLEDETVSDQIKIFRFGHQCFFAVVGRPRIVLRADPTKDVFNVATIVSDFFANLELGEEGDFWEALKERLLGEFRAYLSTIKFGHWPEEDEHSSKVFYKIIFVYTGDGGQIGLTEFSFRYVKKDPPDISMEIVHGWFEGLYLAYGYTQTAYGLREGKPQLKAIAADPAVAPFLDKKSSPDGITFDQALNFIRWVMTASNALNPPAFKVSKEFSYAAIKGKHR